MQVRHATILSYLRTYLVFGFIVGSLLFAPSAVEAQTVLHFQLKYFHIRPHGYTLITCTKDQLQQCQTYNDHCASCVYIYQLPSCSDTTFPLTADYCAKRLAACQQSCGG
jgi:uncharacterized membrane-anchored protein